MSPVFSGTQRLFKSVRQNKKTKRPALNQLKRNSFIFTVNTEELSGVCLSLELGLPYLQ